MTKFIFLFTSLLACFWMNAQNITGDWNGTLKVGGTQLPLVFHISETDKGLAATMDSPAQGAMGIPATSAKFENGIIKIEIANAGIAYEGKLKEGIIEGDFKQGGMSIPLNLSREKVEEQKIRPQEPKEPFSYYSEDVFFQNEKAGIKLAGTLTLPAEKGKFPAVILISGSGPQDRNQEIMDHKPFLVISDYLTRNGIAVLRFDDRGVAKSEGDFSTATTSDFATDVAAAMDFLKLKKQVDQKNIGLIGHSEGGLVAPMVAKNSEDIAFLVLLAAPGIRGEKLMLSQKEVIERKMGASELQVTMGKQIMSGAYNLILSSEKTGEALRKEVNEYLKGTLGRSLNENAINQLTDQITSGWMMGFLKNDPAVTLEKIKIPVLAMNGKNDLQVLSEENLTAIKNALEKGGNKNITIKEFENLNHLFQESESGLPNEYGEIEQTFSPEALEFMSEWILGQVK